MGFYIDSILRPKRSRLFSSAIGYTFVLTDKGYSYLSEAAKQAGMRIGNRVPSIWITKGYVEEVLL